MWDKNYVRKKYEAFYLGQSFIFYPATDCKRLLVFFSSMAKDKYDRYSWFWNENENWRETSYLFIKDDSFSYYLGNDDKPLKDTFRKIIQSKMDEYKLSPKQVTTIGASMGGYAALYYASYMNLLGAICLNPQINISSSKAHQYDNWTRSMLSTGSQWRDLDAFLLKNEVPRIFLEYGCYPADIIAVDSLLERLEYTEFDLILRKKDWKEHSVNGLSKSTIESTVRYFEDSFCVQ